MSVPSRGGSQEGRWTLPAVVFVIDRPRANERDLGSLVDAAIEGGVGMVVLRDRVSPAGQMLADAQTLRARIPASVPFLLNDRLDVALACGADGVHLPERGLPLAWVREQLPPAALVGQSVHSVVAALRSVQAGADYLLVGTMFPTDCKPGHQPEGLPLLRAICDRVAIPVFGIGGVGVRNARVVVEAGAQGVAVVSALSQASDPARATRQLLEEIRSPSASPLS